MKDTESEVYGKLTIVGPDPNRKTYRIVRCECGVVKSVRLSEMKRGTTVSCGCWRKKVIAIQYAAMGLGPKKKLEGPYRVKNPFKSKLGSELERLLDGDGK